MPSIGISLLVKNFNSYLLLIKDIYLKNYSLFINTAVFVRCSLNAMKKSQDFPSGTAL